jgi:hypothetical protein
MLNDSDSLRVEQSTLADVLLLVRKYRGEERSSQPTGDCQPSDCMATAYVLPAEWYARHPVFIPVVKRMGVHLFSFRITLWVKGGKLKDIEEEFFVPRSVGADVTVTTIASSPGPNPCKNPSYQLHPGFTTKYRERYGTPDFRYWLNGSRPQDASRLPHMDLRCTTTIRGCLTVAQILPTAWEQHQLDQPRIQVLQAGRMGSSHECR